MDNIFCISLDTRTDRRKKVAEQMRLHGLHANFFIVEAHKNPRMGCLISHLNVLQLARHKHLPYVTIVEDDIRLLHDPRESLRNRPAAWDMLYLGGNIQEVYKEPWHADWKRVSTFTTHAYVVNCTIYDVLIDGLTAWKADVESGKIAYEDSAIDQFYAYHVHPDNSCFMCDPICAVQETDYSDIEKRMVNYTPFINNDKLIRARSERTLYMDDVYVINMFRRKDRIRAIDATFSTLGIKYNRWNGTDGAEFVPNKQIQTLFEGNDFGSRCGILGCAVSHYELWAYLANSSALDHIAIFEDDIELTPTFVKQWGNYYREIERLDENWDFIYMGGCHPVVSERPSPLVADSKCVIRPAPTVQMGLYSYCLSKNGARKLLHLAKKNGIRRAIDWFAVDSMPVLHAYQVWPSLTYSFSGIDSDTYYQTHRVVQDENGTCSKRRIK